MQVQSLGWKDLLEEEMASYFSIVAWKIPWRVTDFILLGSRITVDGDCSHEIRRCLLLGRKVLTNLDSIFKSRDITLPTKVCIVKAMVLPAVMYGCENWTTKKAVLTNWCFQTVVLEETLESPLDCKIKPVHPKGNQPWIFTGRTDAEAPIFGHLMQRTDSLEKILMLGRIESRRRRGNRRWDGWMASLTQWP